MRNKSADFAFNKIEIVLTEKNHLHNSMEEMIKIKPCKIEEMDV